GLRPGVLLVVRERRRDLDGLRRLIQLKVGARELGADEGIVGRRLPRLLVFRRRAGEVAARAQDAAEPCELARLLLGDLLDADVLGVRAGLLEMDLRHLARQRRVGPQVQSAEVMAPAALDVLEGHAHDLGDGASLALAVADLAEYGAQAGVADLLAHPGDA